MGGSFSSPEVDTSAISKKRYKNLLEQFADLDTDKNTVLSFDEFKKYVCESGIVADDLIKVVFEGADSSGDEFISASEFVAIHAEQHKYRIAQRTLAASAVLAAVVALDQLKKENDKKEADKAAKEAKDKDAKKSTTETSAAAGGAAASSTPASAPAAETDPKKIEEAKKKAEQEQEEKDRKELAAFLEKFAKLWTPAEGLTADGSAARFPAVEGDDIKSALEKAAKMLAKSTGEELGKALTTIRHKEAAVDETSRKGEEDAVKAYASALKAAEDAFKAANPSASPDAVREGAVKDLAEKAKKADADRKEAESKEKSGSLDGRFGSVLADKLVAVVKKAQAGAAEEYAKAEGKAKKDELKQPVLSAAVKIINERDEEKRKLEDVKGAEDADAEKEEDRALPIPALTWNEFLLSMKERIEAEADATTTAYIYNRSCGLVVKPITKVVRTGANYAAKGVSTAASYANKGIDASAGAATSVSKSAVGGVTSAAGKVGGAVTGGGSAKDGESSAEGEKKADGEKADEEPKEESEPSESFWSCGGYDDSENESKDKAARKLANNQDEAKIFVAAAADAFATLSSEATGSEDAEVKAAVAVVKKASEDAAKAGKDGDVEGAKKAATAAQDGKKAVEKAVAQSKASAAAKKVTDLVAEVTKTASLLKSLGSTEGETIATAAAELAKTATTPNTGSLVIASLEKTAGEKVAEIKGKVAAAYASYIEAKEKEVAALGGDASFAAAIAGKKGVEGGKYEEAVKEVEDQVTKAKEAAAKAAAAAPATTAGGAAASAGATA